MFEKHMCIHTIQLEWYDLKSDRDWPTMTPCNRVGNWNKLNFLRNELNFQKVFRIYVYFAWKSGHYVMYHSQTLIGWTILTYNETLTNLATQLQIQFSEKHQTAY